MRKSLLLLCLSIFTLLAGAQIIVTNPAFVTKDYTGQIEIVYDATKGTAGLKDYTGADGVYAHTGVITTASATDKDWKHAPAWGDNAAKYKMTSLGSNKWKLIITPNIAGYYGLTTGEVVNKLAFVFRNGIPTGTPPNLIYKEGKDVGGTDIFVPLYDAGLNVAFTSPTSNQSVTAGSSVSFVVTSSLSADLSLSVNGTVAASVAGATTLSHTYQFVTPNDYLVVATASIGGSTVYDTLRVNVPSAVVTEARPAGVKNGINYNSDTSVTLVLHAPTKNNVFVIGEFNDWSKLNAYQMKKDGEYWWITLNDLTPGKLYSYQYLVDGSIRISDPYTELVLDPWNDPWINEKYNRFPNLKAYPAGKTEGLVATFQTAKTAYNWEVTNFATPSRDNMVIYELLLRDFTVEKSLEAAITKLDYLKTLGITAVELMPIQEFDGNESWGYNPNHYFAPDKAYGSPEMYKKFIDECHKRGMAVIIDVVFNHATGNNPMAALFWNAATSKTTSSNPWFNVSAPHPYSVFHDYNHEYAGTRDYFKRVLQYWIQEYKVDGYRLDLTKGFTQNSSSESTASNYDQSRINILTDYYNAAKAEKSDVMFILEHFCNYDEELALANNGMYLWRKVNNAYSQSAMGYAADSDFGAMNSLPRKWVGYAESHDEERNFFKAKSYGSGSVKTDSVYRVSRVPLNIAFATLIPGPKMLWQFQEMGYDYSIDSQGGRTNAKPSAWGWLNLAHRKAAYETAAKIITIRKMFPTAFTEGNFDLKTGTSDWENGRVISLTHSDLNLVVMGNFKPDAGATVYATFPKTGMWYNAITGESTYVSSNNTSYPVNAGKVLILADRKINFPSGIDDPYLEDIEDFLYPTVTSGRVYIKNATHQNELKVFNVQGQEIKTLSNVGEIDLSELQAGLYLIKMKTLSTEVSGKVLKY